MGNCFLPELVVVGNYSYGPLYVLANVDTNKLLIGNFVSIANDVVFVLADEHPTSKLSTYPFKRMLLGGGEECFSKGDIVVDDDVWIGSRAQILSGVHINQGAIVAANAVVTKDVPPYAIVGGVPARVLKYRFDQDTIQKMLNIDYSKINSDFVKENEELFYGRYDASVISRLPHKNSND